MYNPDIHHRTTIRIKDYDYSKEGHYYITICIRNRENILGTIENNKMVLNEFGVIVENDLLNISNKFKNTEINVYAIMPNHLHFILEIKEGNEIALGNIIRYFKGRTTSKIKRKKMWQSDYYEHVIRNEKDYYEKYQYIINNPYNWKGNEIDV